MTLPYYWTLSSLESSSSQKHPKDDARVRARRPHEKPNVDHATPPPPPPTCRRRRRRSLALLGVKASSRTFFLSGYKFLIFLAPKFKCFCMIKPNVDHSPHHCDWRSRSAFNAMVAFFDSWPFASLFAEFLKFRSDTYLFYGLSVFLWIFRPRVKSI